jgi:IrrE N-terminal-like domain
MTYEVPRADDIRRAAEKLLLKADVHGRLPTPVDDIVAAAGLVEPQHSLLSEFILEQAPAHLRSKIRKLRLKVRAVLDRRAREIHIDPSLHIHGQIAFKKLHEVGHDICPWQRDLAYADDDETLSWSTDQRLEREANQAAAELLFQRTLFQDMAAQYEIGIAAILDLAALIGSSGHAAFRRFIETHRWALAGVVMDLSPRSRDPLMYQRREVASSTTWDQRFGSLCGWPTILRPVPYSFILLGPGAVAMRSVRSGTFRYPDLRNEQVDLKVEMYSNSYKLFVLFWVPRKERLRHRRLIVPTSSNGG